MTHQEALSSYIGAFVAEMYHAGIRDVVISPGSRSTPLAMILAEHPGFRLHIHVDERSAAFFALGIAKATQKPVAILCTSGTAAANYYPAIVEAYLSRVPLLVLTADRPHELRDVGAPQTIDQIHLYGRHVKWFVEMSPPEGNLEMVRYARTVCSRAVALASSSPAGPVHLNFPFRDPLVPKLGPDLFALPEREQGYIKVSDKTYFLSEQEWEALIRELSSAKNGIIVCGSIDDGDFAGAVVELAKKLQFPILADPLSQLRSGNHDGSMIIDTYDSFLRNEEARKALQADIIIRFGAMPVSKYLTFFIKENAQAKYWVVDGGGGWREPALVATNMIYAKEKEFCLELAAKIEQRDSRDYFLKWKTMNELAKKRLAKVKDISRLSEGRLFYELSELLPAGATLFVGNSMPIRDLDTFFHYNTKSVKIMANRGANGIDGTVSTALGAATVREPVYLVLGDLTFFHDLNGLIQAKQERLNIKIIVVNNNGGGIFSFLPQAAERKNFEKLFGTPLDLRFEHAVRMYGGRYADINDWDHFFAVFNEFSAYEGLSVMEIKTNREVNMREHRSLWEEVSREINRYLHGEVK